MPFAWTKNGPLKDPQEPALLVVNFSGGVQSTAIVEMLLAGELDPKVPRDRILVLTADPGMEATSTYATVRRVQAKCLAAGISAYTVSGPSLYEALLDTKRTRIDNPAYYVESKTSRHGRLRQKCTREYKIRPMQRAIRAELRARGLPVRGPRAEASVEKWIGFAYDEVAKRMSLPDADFERFRFPLADRKMTKADVEAWLRKANLPVPDRSVCNACFANTAAYFCKLKDNDPAGWARAVAVDRALREHAAFARLSGKVFVSDTMKPVEDIVGSDVTSEDEGEACESSYCFT